MSNIVSLKEHQNALCQRADVLIGDAILLRSKLKHEINLPLPDKEMDELIQALIAFISASERFPR